MMRRILPTNRMMQAPFTRLVIIGVIIGGLVAPIANYLYQQSRYQINPSTRSLVGKSNTTLAAEITYDAKKDVYQFNKDAVKNTIVPNEAQHNTVGTPAAKGSATFAVDLPTQMNQGITYHETNAQLSFRLVPQFRATDGRNMNGQMVYPLASGAQAIYTLKGNGLKEDIVLTRAPSGGEASYSYKIVLPKTLAAKMLPGHSGEVGIYSVDPALLGTITYGSTADQTNVERAREDGAKTHLLFAIPAPIVRTGSKIAPHARANFSLAGDTLTVHATGLGGLKGPLSIDPSVVVTSASDFTTAGNNDGNINFVSSGQINRANLTGGSVSGGWITTATSGAIANSAQNAIAYNGYLYQVNGTYNTGAPGVLYAPISSSNGTVGSWTSTTAPTAGRVYGGAVIYNGYMYAYGGYSTPSSSSLASVEYAPVNNDGSVGTWITSSNSMTYGVCNAGFSVYNGYLYAVGGANATSGTNCSNTSTPTTYVQYAPLNGDGSVGPWTSSTNQFSSARMGDSSFAYNGYLYVLGGYTASIGTLYADVQYAPLSTTGSVGAWMTTTSMGTQRGLAGVTVYDGYIYIVQGNEQTIGTSSTVIYAQINAGGTLGNWASSSSTPSIEDSAATTSYNGYIYEVGGSSSGTASNVTNFAKIDSAGMNVPFSTTGNTELPTARNFASSVAYNGYMYVLGGSSTTSRGSTGANTVIYAPINPNGTLGSWTTGTTFVSSRVRSDGAVAVYNGYLYYLGGTATSQSYSAEVQYAPIASDGSVGTWTDTTSLGVGRFGDVAWAYNGKMYVAGGYHGTVDTLCTPAANHYCSDVQMASINSDGTLSTWAAQTSLIYASYDPGIALNGAQVYISGGDGGGGSQVSMASMSPTSGAITAWSGLTGMPAARANTGQGISGGYLYIWSNKGTGALNTIFAKLTSTGMLASDAGCGTTFCTGQSPASSTVAYRANYLYQGVMYSIGGTDTTAASTAVESSPINNGGNGDVGTWTTSASTFATARFDQATVANNGYLYLLGGKSGSTVYSDVQYAPITASGDIGTWTTLSATPLYTTLYSLGAQVYNGYLYIMGGNDGTTRHGDVYYAKINSDGTLGTWTGTNGFTASARSTFGSVAYQGYMYVLGGVSSASVNLNTVYYAPINAIGTLGTWASSTAFTTARYAAGAFAANGNIYLLGGSNGAYLSDVQYAPLNPGTGAVGTWVATTSLPTLRAYASTSFLNGYVYLVGGYDGTNYFNDVQIAPVNASGNLGQWAMGTNAITAGRYGQSSVVYDGNLYVSGGYASGTYKNDTQFTPVESLNRSAVYTKLIDLGGPENVSSLTYSGALPGRLSAISYKTANSTGVFGTSLSDVVTITTTGNCLTGLGSVRYIFASFSIDDSADTVFADSLISTSAVTDFTVNYVQGHPNNDIHLHGGQTLQTGVLSQFDTCF